jgi:hypothetical protein
VEKTKGDKNWSGTSDFTPVSNTNLKSVSAYDWGSNAGDDFLGQGGLTQRVLIWSISSFSLLKCWICVQTEVKAQSDWDDSGWEPLEDVSTGDSKMDEARRKREEKKQQRQKELEARRASRSAGMKLGAKKAWWPQFSLQLLHFLPGFLCT